MVKSVQILIELYKTFVRQSSVYGGKDIKFSAF